jgi:hypothetical protein
LDCHQTFHAGLVEDWLTSHHARVTPEAALKEPELQRCVSSTTIPDALKPVAVGCFECHGLNPSRHKDNFEHFGFKINVIVSANDCQTCHTAEAEQFAGSKKAHALGNLRDNSIYNALVETILGLKEIKDGKVTPLPASDNAKLESCYACHGSQILVKGLKKIDSDAGELEIPDLVGWPNQGVGRENPDGSLGACTACHTRHGFSIEVARKPYTCSQCHLEPDVPAWDVYRESKHGNLFNSQQQGWNWEATPWKAGKDFRAPTCAACHNGLVSAPDGEVLTPRTHDFGARLWVRLFGLPYAHPQPKSGKTSIIKNKDGQPLPATFTGDLASEHLIDQAEQAKRKAIMKKLCQTCHNQDYVNLHFARLDQTIAETDKAVLAATQLLLQAQKQGLVDPSNPFDESLEQKWIKQWLFYANSIRYSSAMSGPDYAAFKNGWWGLTHNLQEMRDAIEMKGKIKR